jgi:flagellar assembly factor FliW
MPATAAHTATDVRELRFDDGIPGFPDQHRFTLSRWGGDDSPFSLLESVDDAALRFVVVPPEVFFPTYAPVLGDDDAARLGLTEADDAIVLVVVTLGDAAADATANLLGPVVINRHSLSGAQVVLTSQDLPTRAPLVGS